MFVFNSTMPIKYLTRRNYLKFKQVFLVAKLKHFINKPTLSQFSNKVQISEK